MSSELKENNESSTDDTTTTTTTTGTSSTPKTIRAYCVRCRDKVTLVDPVARNNARGVKMLQGICPNPNCKSKVNTFVKKDVPPVLLPDNAVSLSSE